MGGAGLILTDRFPSFFVFIYSASAGFCISYLINRFILKPLHKMQNTSTHDKYDLIGSIAKVSLSIPQNGYGKIKYTVNGSIVTSPAKTENGDGIKKDTEVSILYIKDNTYFVRAVERAESEAVNWAN
jgi:membrane protein implicated in regulation of membrane protease activity